MRFTKFIVPAVALGLFAIIPSHIVRADDAPATTQPAANGSVTIKVVDESGNPVAGVKVEIVASKGHKQPKEKTPPVAQGETDANGSVTLSGIPDGSYRATAHSKAGRGNEKVTVGGADAATAPITITLKPGGKHQTPPAQ